MCYFMIIYKQPRLLEMITEGMNVNPHKYQEMLVEEALPLIYHKTPELPSHLVCRLFTISLQYYSRQLIEEVHLLFFNKKAC